MIALLSAGESLSPRDLIENLVGASVWAVGISLLGFWARQIDQHRSSGSIPIVAVIIVLSLIPPYLEYRTHDRSPSARR